MKCSAAALTGSWVLVIAVLLQTETRVLVSTVLLTLLTKTWILLTVGLLGRQEPHSTLGHSLYTIREQGFNEPPGEGFWILQSTAGVLTQTLAVTI